MKDKEFDKLFDDGKDVSHLLELSSGRRPNQDQKHDNGALPLRTGDQLDSEARRVGVARTTNITACVSQRPAQVTTNKIRQEQPPPQGEEDKNHRHPGPLRPEELRQQP